LDKKGIEKMLRQFKSDQIGMEEVMEKLKYFPLMIWVFPKSIIRDN
jgi:hypothetical protein